MPVADQRWRSPAVQNSSSGPHAAEEQETASPLTTHSGAGHSRSRRQSGFGQGFKDCGEPGAVHDLKRRERFTGR
jgi:hypothetical protein